MQGTERLLYECVRCKARLKPLKFGTDGRRRDLFKREQYNYQQRAGDHKTSGCKICSEISL
jgi:hypothetical protein